MKMEKIELLLISSLIQFGCICFVVLVMRKGGESSLKWSLAFRPYTGSFQDQFIQPGWAECFLGIYYLA